MIEEIKSWNEVAGRSFPSTPTLLSTEDYHVLIRLIIEEAQETIDACKGFLDNPGQKELSKIFDGIADCAYVQYGFLLQMGIDPKDVVAVVTKSNFSKFEVDDEVAETFAAEKGYTIKKVSGKVNVFYDENGKVRKGPNYKEPDWNRFMSDILRGMIDNLKIELNDTDQQR